MKFFKMLIFLFKRLICLPVAIIMIATFLAVIPAIIVIPIYWCITNRNFIDDGFNLLEYANNTK